LLFLVFVASTHYQSLGGITSKIAPVNTTNDLDHIRKRCSQLLKNACEIQWNADTDSSARRTAIR
jgi:hypothetical protein